MTPPGRRKWDLQLLVLTFALVCNFATVDGHEASYIGCFGDSAASNQKRALPYGFVMDHSMTHERCFSICGDRGLEYAGMEYGQECWCSAAPVTNYPRIADDRCDMPCEGNTKQKCGGPNALTVFHIKTAAVSEEHKKRMEGRPLLALVMILKNEAHTLKNTFTTVQDFINVWYILDTGSNDGTQDLIRRELAKIPGKLYEEPFVDYGFTRNRILDIANQSDPRPIFTIMLSADEQVVNMGELIPFLKSHIYAFGPQHDAYPVVMNTGILFDSLRIARVDGDWRYQGRVHEYLAAPGGRWVDVCRPVPDIRVNFQATDNDRRFKSQWFIASILEDEISKKPNDTRSLYYLARTYQTISNFTASFNIYKRLASVSSWDEERYESLFNLGLLCQQMNWDWSRCHQLFLDAHEHKPSKVDVLYHLALYYHGKGKQYYPIAYIYAKEAMLKTIPENIQTVQNVLMRESISTYQYRAAQLTAQLASAIGEYQTCIDACNKWLDFNPQELMAQTIRENCIREMPKITTTTAPPIVKKKKRPPTETVASTPTPTWRIKRLYDQYMHPSNAIDPHLVTDSDGYVETANPFHRLSPVSAIMLGVSILVLVALLMYVNRRRKKFKGK